MQQLGGHAIFYSIVDSPLGKKENIHDTATVASLYVNLIAARVYNRQDVRDFAKDSKVPVINMLDDFAHPCQILCDFLTIKEKKGRLENLKMSFFGDGYNNVTYDLMRICAMFGFKMDVACPSGADYSPEKEVLDEIAELSKTTGAEVRVVHDAKEAAKDADIIYTDSWMSYGIPAEQEEERKKVFMPYQVTSEIINMAKPDVIFMNCLPAKRGYEQTAEVIDGPKSIVFDQAENRLHGQKAIMLFLRDKF
jgi:ornithine carbamoyltransferase